MTFDIQDCCSTTRSSFISSCPVCKTDSSAQILSSCHILFWFFIISSTWKWTSLALSRYSTVITWNIFGISSQTKANHKICWSEHQNILLKSLEFPTDANPSVMSSDLCKFLGESVQIPWKKSLRSTPVSQSCAVAKSRKFWWARTGQSNLADRMEDCSIGQRAVVWVKKPNFGFCCSQLFVCEVWLCSGPLECFRMFLATVHDCETGVDRWTNTCQVGGCSGFL